MEDAVPGSELITDVTETVYLLSSPTYFNCCDKFKVEFVLLTLFNVA